MADVCAFCPGSIDGTSDETYHEVSSWVSGPKLDGPKLRQHTGRLAHKRCVENLSHGQAADQPALIEEEVDEPLDIINTVAYERCSYCEVSMAVCQGNVEKCCKKCLHAPKISDTPGTITKLTGPGSVTDIVTHVTRQNMGGNAGADCTCGTNPHREDCRRYGRG